MRIAERYLQEIINHQGSLASGPITKLGVLRLALDLREAREKIAALEMPKLPESGTQRKPARVLATREIVTSRFGDPRRDGSEETVLVQDIVVGSKVDVRA